MYNYRLRHAIRKEDFMSYGICPLRKGGDRYYRCVRVVELLPADSAEVAQEESWVGRRMDGGLKEALF